MVTVSFANEEAWSGALGTPALSEDARAEARRRFHATESTEERIALLDEALPHLDTQLALVRRRLVELQELEAELVDRRKRVLRRRRELSG